MRTLFAMVIVALAALPAWACWNQFGTCTNGTSTAGQGCKSPGVTPRACFISVSGVGCYRVYNSTGKDLFIPTKTIAEFSAFVASPGTGVTATSTTVGTTCFPSCYMVVGSCPSPAGSGANPP